MLIEFGSAVRRHLACALLALLALHVWTGGCADDAAHSGGSSAAGSSAGASAAVSGVGGGAGMMLADSGAAMGAGSAGLGTSGAKLSFATDVYEAVIRKRCGNCHNDAPSFGGLAFFPGGADAAYANLVGVPAGSEVTYLCRTSGLLRVDPGEPQASLIYLKLTDPPCGSRMPPVAFGTTTAEQVELVRKWIADGAAP